MCVNQGRAARVQWSATRRPPVEFKFCGIVRTPGDCSNLSMNRPSPGLRPPSPRLAGRGVPIGSWLRFTSEFWRCSLSMNRLPVAASRQSADYSSHELRRSAETPLRGGAWSRCAVAKPWKLSLNFAAQMSAIASGFCLLFPPATTCAADSALGQFEGHGDIGSVLRPGSVEYEATKQTYLIAGGGENMWFTNDAFHFVWKSVVEFRAREDSRPALRTSFGIRHSSFGFPYHSSTGTMRLAMM